MKERINILQKKFNELFPESKKPKIVAGPGRINVIGGHTDYNLGFVLPTAVDVEILMMAENRADDKLKMYSLDFNEGHETELSDLKFDKNKNWANYIMGVFYFLKEAGYKIKGVNIVFSGNIPLGGGLSSSAALEVATAYVIRLMQGLKLNDIDMIKICQKAENKFVGVMCGIMDQFASAMSKKNKLILLDCADLSYKLIPMNDLADIKFVICDTKKERTLVGSEYNKRRQQCTDAAGLLKKYLPKIRALRDVNISDFEKLKSKLPAPERFRAEHVIYENFRVLKAVKALKINDLELIGKLQRESQKSMKDLFEISCEEIDIMVGLADSVKGVYGTRIIGGGFGGCTISLVKGEAVEEVRSKILSEYPKKTGKNPEIWVCNSSDGAREIQ